MRIKLVQDLAGSGDALQVVVVRSTDARQHRAQAGGFRTTEFAIADVDIVEHLGDADQSCVVGQISGQNQRFEGAAILCMSELAVG